MEVLYSLFFKGWLGITERSVDGASSLFFFFCLFLKESMIKNQSAIVSPWLHHLEGDARLYEDLLHTT